MKVDLAKKFYVDHKMLRILSPKGGAAALRMPASGVGRRISLHDPNASHLRQIEPAKYVPCIA